MINGTLVPPTLITYGLMKNLTQITLLTQILLLIAIMIALIVDPLELEITHKKAILLALAIAIAGAIIIILVLGITLEGKYDRDKWEEIHQKTKAGLDQEQEEK